MKTEAFMLAIGLAVCAVASNAYCDTLNTAGSACVAYYGSQQSNLYYNVGRVGSYTGAATTVQCPVPRQVGNRSMTVYVDFNHIQNVSTTCTVYVMDNDGTPLTSRAIGVSGTGALRGSASFTAAENPSWAYTSVMCSLNAYSSVSGVTAAY